MATPSATGTRGGPQVSQPEDTEALVCVPVAIARAVVYGSHQTACERCLCAVWVAPTGLAALQLRPAMQVICTACLPAAIAESGEKEVKFMPMNAAQVQELRRHYRGDQEE